MRKGYRQLLDEADALVETVSAQDAAARAAAGEAVLVDIRDPREIARDGRIPGAKHCTRGMLEFWIDPDSPYHKPWFASGQAYVFYCASGWRSALATRTALEMGLAPVMHLRGGLAAWREAGLPVEPGAEAARATARGEA